MKVNKIQDRYGLLPKTISENKLNEIISNQLLEYKGFESHKDSDDAFACEFKCSEFILDKLTYFKRQLKSIRKHNPEWLNSMKNIIRDELKEYKKYMDVSSSNSSCNDCKYIRYTIELKSLEFAFCQDTRKVKGEADNENK